MNGTIVSYVGPAAVEQSQLYQAITVVLKHRRVQCNPD
jgi:hypothetical protein